MAYFDTCPKCGSDNVSGNRRQSYARCEACGFESRVGEALPESGIMVPKTSNPLDPLLLSFPSVIALPLNEYLQEQNPVLKLWHACDVIELMLRLLVMTGLADIKRHGELPEPLLNELRSRIEEPTLGKWKGMALAIAKHIQTSATVVPELPALVNDHLVPFLDGPAEGPPAVERSFSALRNHLAHGGGITQAVAAGLLALWEAPFSQLLQKAAWLSDLDLLVRNAAGDLGALRGPTTKTSPYSSLNADAHIAAFSSKDEVILVRGDVWLSLWPLKLYGLPQQSDPEALAAREVTPQVYVRRGEVRLQFTPVGSEEVCQSEADETAMDAFRTLFRLDQTEEVLRNKGFEVRGFEVDIRKDAGRLVGRFRELESLQSALSGMADGALWIWGTAGIGKSYLIAGLAAELLDTPPPQTLVLPYRFKVGDDRCSRDKFLQFTLERMEAWPDLPPSTDDPPADKGQVKPLDRLRELLRGLKDSPLSLRVIFLLDGLDEIVERDPRFATEVPLGLCIPGVVWLCAGRPERGLPEAFSQDRCVQPFPNGLPPMEENDIRAMLLEKIGPLRKQLLQKDREEGERIVNPFLERVVVAANGLPLYVSYVIGDILNGRLRALDAGVCLPPSLEAYHEALLRRCAVGTLQQVVTPLAATLAAASDALVGLSAGGPAASPYPDAGG